MCLANLPVCYRLDLADSSRGCEGHIFVARHELTVAVQLGGQLLPRLALATEGRLGLPRVPSKGNTLPHGSRFGWLHQLNLTERASVVRNQKEPICLTLMISNCGLKMFTCKVIRFEGLTLVWSSFDAAKTIACDFIPRIATGFRLQSTQTFRFC